jgi:hypothetical protein
MNMIHWQTGRNYSRSVQKGIIAKRVSPSHVMFCDMDRGIDGLVELEGELDSKVITGLYDAGKYSEATVSEGCRTIREYLELNSATA